MVSLIVVEFVLQTTLTLNNLLQSKQCNLVVPSHESTLLVQQLREERNSDDVWEGLYGNSVNLAVEHDNTPQNHEQLEGRVTE